MFTNGPLEAYRNIDHDLQYIQVESNVSAYWGSITINQNLI